jgi:hypothetical protein
VSGKWMADVAFPADTPVVRSMESKYSDSHVTLIVPEGERYVALLPDVARDLAADLLLRAEHIDPRTPEQVAAWHVQVGRPDGTFGCRCGWIQSKPHRAHVADIVAAARNEAAS